MSQECLLKNNLGVGHEKRMLVKHEKPAKRLLMVVITSGRVEDEEHADELHLHEVYVLQNHSLRVR